MIYIGGGHQSNGGWKWRKGRLTWHQRKKSFYTGVRNNENEIKQFIMSAAVDYIN